MKKRIWTIACAIILAFLSFGALALVFPQKFASLKHKITSFVSALTPHDAGVIKPTGIVALPSLARASTPTPTPTPLSPPPARFSRSDFTHHYQTWNNCGPATLSIALSGYGIAREQKDIAAAVKPDPDDKNVSSDELVQYTKETTDLLVLYRMNGTLELAKNLASHGFVVVLETWFEPHPDDGMGHFRLITGYDDEKKLFTLSDSYDGPKATTSYEVLEKEWQVYGYPYMVLYKKEQEKELERFIGADMDEQVNWQHLLDRTEGLLAENKENAFAWFNRGKALTHVKKYQDAAISFDAARKIGLPWRMLWYQFEIFDAYLAVGRYDDVVTLTNANLRQAGNLEESWYYQSKALEKLGKTKEAADAIAKVTQYNPHYFQYHP